jgi:hypothetical protein
MAPFFISLWQEQGELSRVGNIQKLGSESWPGSRIFMFEE